MTTCKKMTVMAIKPTKEACGFAVGRVNSNQAHDRCAAHPAARCSIEKSESAICSWKSKYQPIKRRPIEDRAQGIGYPEKIIETWQRDTDYSREYVP